MQIYIMRHGQASPVGITDAERELTAEGQCEVKVMAKWLLSLPVKFDCIFTSPFVRAQQTCQSLVSILDAADKVSSLALITPSGEAQQVHDYIDGMVKSENHQEILMISHLPLVSYLVLELTQGHDSPIFQTAAIAQIDYDEINMTGKLVRLITPDDLC
jgi:phosphohistidine phosphatase